MFYVISYIITGNFCKMTMKSSCVTMFKEFGQYSAIFLGDIYFIQNHSSIKPSKIFTIENAKMSFRS